MKKFLAGVTGAAVFAAPMVALGQGTAASQQLIPLYVQLVNFLQEELAMLQHPDAPRLSVRPAYGTLPLRVLFTLENGTGKEVILFGDGLYAGGNACMKNEGATCDLTEPVAHTYDTPGTYTVNLYTYPSPGSVVGLSTTTVLVVQPLSSL